MHLKRLSLILCLIAILAAAPVSAAIRYVSTSGKDGSTIAGTLEAPWRTIKYAVGRVSSDDEIVVRGGLYSEENITFRTPGITLRNYPNETPIIDGDRFIIPPEQGGPDKTVYSSLIYVFADDCVIDGFIIRNSRCYGLFTQNANNTIVRNCEIYETWRAGLVLYTNSDGSIVEDCDIHHGSVWSLWWRKLGTPTRIDAGNIDTKRTDGFVFRRCKIRDAYCEGIDLDIGSVNGIVEFCEIYGSPKLQLYTAGASSCIIRYNLIYGTDNGDGPGIWLGNEPDDPEPVVGNIMVYGNFVANTKRNMWISGTTGHIVENSLVFNNTFVEATEWNFIIEDQTGVGHVIKNNIFLQSNNAIAYVPRGKATFASNLWSREPDPDAKGLYDPAYSSPDLAKAANWNQLRGGELTIRDFAIGPNSAAAGTGLVLFPADSPHSELIDCDVSTSIDGAIARSQLLSDKNWDIGADLTDKSSSSTSTIFAPTLRIVIN